MSMVINTNLSALTAQRSLAKTSVDMSTALQRLSTGLRINGAKDDAAGMAIAERMTTQIRGYNQAIRNAGDGISVAQTAEGGLEAISNSLQRMRELMVQAANFSNTTDERGMIDLEVMEMVKDVNRVANQTNFNGKNLLTGTFTAASFQVGANATETITATSIGDMRAVALGLEATPGGTLLIDAITNPSAALGILDTAINTVTTARAGIGATVNRFEQVISNLRVTVENVTAARSRIQDADFAAETAALTRLQILQQSGSAVLSQANAIPQNVLALLR